MFRRGLKATGLGRTAQHYRAIPMVNLLPRERRAPLKLFGAEGVEVFVRLGLVAAILLGGAVVLISRDQVALNEDLEAAANRRSSAALATVDEALDLQGELDLLRSTGDVSAQDYAFLLGNPGALVDALQSVFALEVEGIVIVDIETDQEDLVSARLYAESNKAAFEWRRLIGSAPGVSRVLSFDPVLSTESLIYDVSLISGGN